MITRSTIHGASLAVALLATTISGQSASLRGLVAHRAVYDIKLDEASDRSGIRDMNGRIVYEIAGSSCEGFAVKFRFVSQIDTGRKSFITDQRTTTFEDARSENFRFLTRSFVNDQFEKEVRGSARRTARKTDVSLKKPESREMQLGKSIFMTAHLANVIKKARKGEKFYFADVYDGSDDADELLSTTTIIGGLSAKKTEKLPEKIKSLGDTPNWPVSISYFSLKNEQQGENLPVYQVSFDLYENGISADLIMKYKDYSLKGRLTELELLPNTPCE